MRSLPRFQEVGTLRRPAQYVEPLPPSLLARLGERGEQHAQLAGRYSEGAKKVQELGAELERAKRGDIERERQALKAGKPVPAGKAAKVSEQLVEAERQLAILTDLVRESAVELLQASIPHVGEAKSEAETTTEAALAESEEHARLALAAMQRAEAHAAESGWLAGLELHGSVSPWTGGSKAQPSPRAVALLRSLAKAYDEDRFQLQARREHTEREREVEDAMPLPPGRHVWRLGEEFVVGANGELEKVAREVAE